MSEGSAQDEVSAARRWFYLLLVSVVIGTNYYAYDALSAIKQTLQIELGISSTDYGLIVSFYSFPNTFLLMAVVGGIILDRYGVRLTGTLFTLFCALGVLLTAVGTLEVFRAHALWIMIAGRLLFGLGAETSIVVINKVIAKWFKKRELALAFAVNLAIARLGTAMALISSPRLKDSATGWTTAVWTAALLMGVGFFFFLIYAAQDRKAEQGRLLEPDEEFHFSDITDLLKNPAFIYISMLCVTFYSAVFPFQAFCPDLLTNKFGLDEKAAGDLTSLIIWGTIAFTPFFGRLVDLHGRRATLMIAGSAMLLLSHLTLSLTTLTPYLAMFILGIAFSLVPAAMWPGVAVVVDEKRLGTAYGLMTSIQNLGLFAFPMLAGWITDKANPGVTPAAIKAGVAHLDYTYTVLMFASLGLAGLVFALLLRQGSGAGGRALEAGRSGKDTPGELAMPDWIMALLAPVGLAVGGVRMIAHDNRGAKLLGLALVYALIWSAIVALVVGGYA